MIDVKSLRQTKLYLVWIIMKFDARRAFKRTGKVCIASEFREFKDFALWAIAKKKYRIGCDDHLILAKRQHRHVFAR